MQNDKMSRYYLVKAEMLPDVFQKVIKAKELLSTGAAATIQEAVSISGISRSAFYKYRDAATPFFDIGGGHIVTFHVSLRDIPGVLSDVLSVFASSGANILTINQSIPVDGVAAVTISAKTAGMHITSDALMTGVESLAGVIKIEILAG